MCVPASRSRLLRAAFGRARADRPGGRVVDENRGAADDADHGPLSNRSIRARRRADPSDVHGIVHVAPSMSRPLAPHAVAFGQPGVRPAWAIDWGWKSPGGRGGAN